MKVAEAGGEYNFKEAATGLTEIEAKALEMVLIDLVGAHKLVWVSQVAAISREASGGCKVNL